MNVFEIALANPIKFVESSGDKMDRNFSVDLISNFQEKKCYFQKWQRDDYTRLQILSDFVPTFNIYDLSTDLLFLNVVPIDMETNMIGQTFKVYEIPVDFSLIPEGEYYAVISYINELLQVVDLVSEPMMVRDEHENTLLIQYENSENNFSVVFDTGIVFALRVEGAIENFTPQSDDLVYNDQKRNATLLSSIPYRSFTLFIGHAEGVANWMSDRVNRALSCDVVMIDGFHYEKTEGSSWDIIRVDAYAFLGMTIEIMPVENRFLQRLKTGEGPGDIIIVQKIQNYFEISGDMAVAGKFRENTLLEKVCIVRTGDPFILRLGITEGGDEIGEFNIEEIITTLNINYLFVTDHTVYISGITEVSFFSIIYKQLDEKPIPTGLGNGTPNAFGSIGKGATVVYHELEEGDLDQDFNITTGLGNAETQWEGWAIADGRNSTIDMGGLFPIGYKEGEYAVGDTGGSKTAAIANNNLPNHTHKTVVDGTSTSSNLQEENSIAKSRTGGGNSNANLGGIVATPTLGITSAGGGVDEPVPINIMNPYLAVLWVTKITE